MEHKSKHTKIGEIPKNWSLDKLRKNAIVLFSNVDKHIKEDEIPVLLCNYKDVYYYDYILSSISFSAGSVKPSEFNKFHLHKGDVIITKDSEDRKDIAVPAYVIEDIPNLICGYHLAIIRPIKAHLDGVFLSLLLQSHNVNHYFQKLANGVTRFGLTTDSIKNALIPIPSLPEQQKIAEILSTWDLAISNTQNLINELKLRNKGLAQQLLTGKKRLKGFEGEWKEYKISDLFELANRHIDWNENETYDLVSIRRRYGGIFFRGPFLARDIKVKKLKKISTADFLISKRQVSHGAWAVVSKEFDGFLVSDEYDCLKIKIQTTLNSNFWSYFIKQSHMSWYAFLDSIGVHIEKLIFHFRQFKKRIVKIPSLDEQVAIAFVLSEARKELRLYQQQLDTLKEQKKGLMQKLLTGEIRVKTVGDNEEN